jgi:FtsH-binding integral membrane protein
MSNYKEESFDNLEDDKTEEQIQQKIRLGFIRKVYGIISFQFLITTLVIYYAITSKTLQIFMVTNPSFVYLCLAGVIFTEIPILCCQSVAHKVPLNYILLLIFTLCESYILACTTIYYEPLSVLVCAGITLGIVVGLTLYAIFTKTDITMCGGALVSLSIILLVLSIIGLFFTSLFYQTLVNSCAIFLFSLYLIYDTQLVIGKNKKFISADDYIIGAMMIYIDIVTLFIKILMLFGKKKK